MHHPGDRLSKGSALALAVVPAETSLHAAVAAVARHPLWLSTDGPQALVELRLDRMADASAQSLAQAAAVLGPQRLIVTCRSEAEGGGLTCQAPQGAEQQRALYAAALDLGVGYIDVELARLQQDAALRHLIETRPRLPAAAVGIMVSHHGFAARPTSELQAMAAAALALGASAFKIVLDVGDEAQAQGAFVSWAHGPQPLPVLAIALGAQGLHSRLLAGRQAHPPPYTLVRLADGPSLGTALGQPTWEDAHTLYRVTHITAKTRVFGVVGHPVGHSRSPRLHAQAIARRGLDAVYLPFDVPGPLPAWLQHVAAPLGVAGLSVTAPHKAAARLAAHACTKVAQATCAANTLVRTPEGGWRGDNTDGPAAAAMLAPLMPRGLAGSRVLVLGTGGAARAVCWALSEQGAQVMVWGRRASQAADLAGQMQRLRGAVASVQSGHALAGAVTAVREGGLDEALERCQALVHCTPIGMVGTPQGLNACVLRRAQLQQLKTGTVVFDTVYAPERTQLMRWAAAAPQGLMVLGGLSMLEHQAAAQCAQFYGVPSA